MRVLLSSDSEVLRCDVDFYSKREEKLESGIWYTYEDKFIYNQLYTYSYLYQGISSYTLFSEHYRLSFHDPVTKKETMRPYHPSLYTRDLDGVIDLSGYVEDNNKVTQQEVDLMKILYPIIPPQILQDLVYVPTTREKILLTLGSWKSKIKSIAKK